MDSWCTHLLYKLNTKKLRTAALSATLPNSCFSNIFFRKMFRYFTANNIIIYRDLWDHPWHLSSASAEIKINLITNTKSVSHHLWGHVNGEHGPRDWVQALQDILGHRSLSCPHRTRQEHRVLSGHQSLDQIMIAHSVHCGDHDLIERSAAERQMIIKKTSERKLKSGTAKYETCFKKRTKMKRKNRIQSKRERERQSKMGGRK